MSSHFDPDTILIDRTKHVIRIDDFCQRNSLDQKQRRDLKAMFGTFATYHELMANCRRPLLARFS